MLDFTNTALSSCQNFIVTLPCLIHIKWVAASYYDVKVGVVLVNVVHWPSRLVKPIGICISQP
jgi:hypothetical protein